MLLYLHIPFCESKCPYCAFASDRYDSSWHQPYQKALLQQLQHELNRHPQQALDSLYVGGGTPSVIDASFYTPIFENLSSFLKNNAEITIEANPSSLSVAWLQTLRHLGVNRLSIGIQSFHDSKLRQLGRAHTAQQAQQAITTAQQAGFDNISIDLMYCLKNESFSLMKQDIQTALASGISHISLYCLTEEPGTPFYQSGISHDQESYGRQLWQQLEESGFSQYEVANFASRPETKSKHNLGYWHYESYAGIGAGAVGCVENIRYRPPENLQEYIQHPLSYQEEILKPEDQRTEKIFLGLRSEVGVARSLINDPQKADDLLQTGKLREKHNRFYCTDYMLADELALYLI